MDTDNELFAAILARPDDDLPRLVYADWLDENGQPERAEFIRVECAADLTDRESPDYLKLLRQSDQLFKVHKNRWFGQLADGSIADRIFAVTRRGFVDSISISVDLFTDQSDVIATYAPLLRGLHITASGDWQAFFSSPALGGLRSLSFDDREFDHDGVQELAHSRHVGGLTELDISRQFLGPHGMAAIAAAQLPALEELIAFETYIGDDGASELFDSKNFLNLRSLDLSSNLLGSTACHALAAAEGFGRIEHIFLCSNQVTADGIAAMASAPHLAHMRTLNLHSNPIGPVGGRAILASRHWGGLTDINLIGCGVGVEVVNDLRWVYGQNAVKA